MSVITTHVLDLSIGRPGAGVPVILEFKADTGPWLQIAEGITDTDGRLHDLFPVKRAFESGNYRLIYETGLYFLSLGIECFFPQVTVTFTVKDTSQHYHIPLLLSPFGYSTYRGS